MILIRARFDGKVLIPEQPVELPRDRILLIRVEKEAMVAPDDSFLRPVLVPSDPETARQLIHDADSGMENR